MEFRLSCCLGRFMPATKPTTDPTTDKPPCRRGTWQLVRSLFWVAVSVATILTRAEASGGDAPAWMHALVGATLPSYDEKTDAVVLYSETNVTVLSADKIRTHAREAYKILRPAGREHGTVPVNFSPGQ